MKGLKTLYRRRTCPIPGSPPAPNCSNLSIEKLSTCATQQIPNKAPYAGQPRSQTTTTAVNVLGTRLENYTLIFVSSEVEIFSCKLIMCMDGTSSIVTFLKLK